jgi:hypothetical protein
MLKKIISGGQTGAEWVATRKVSMDDETMKALEILREVNEALITGLEGAISCMENWDKFI